MGLPASLLNGVHCTTSATVLGDEPSSSPTCPMVATIGYVPAESVVGT